MPFALALLLRYVSAPRAAGFFSVVHFTFYGGMCIRDIRLLKAFLLHMPNITPNIHAGKALLAALQYTNSPFSALLLHNSL